MQRDHPQYAWKAWRDTIIAVVAVIVIGSLASANPSLRAPRGPHESILVVPTGATDAEVRATLGDMHRRMMAVAEELSEEEARTVVRFLRRMSEAIAEPTSHGGN